MNHKTLILHSLVSRIFFISICTLSHFLLKHYDLSTNLNESKSMFTSLLKWDAVHFRDITMNGYLQEHTFAFFPLLPYVVRCFYTFLNGPLVFFGLEKHFNFDQFTVGILIINLIFIINSLLLYKLTLFIFDLELAKFTFYLYIFNPASIICSSMYTETLFMLLFLIGLFFVIKQKEIQSTFILSISVLCRSNGLLFCILLFYFKRSLIHLIIFLIPIGFFQLYVLEKIMSFRIFPDLKSYLEVFDDTHNLTLDDKKALDSFEYKENLISVSEAVTFSSKSPLLIFKKKKIMIPYSFVQKKYWNQGFLNFFNIPNIPNVLIGLPFILFTFYILLVNDLKCKNNTLILKNLKILLFLKTILACFFFHWNMYFRLISFNPFLYWSIAKMYLKGKHSAYFILYLKYYFAFSVSYAILFGAFYPPA